MRTQPVRIPGRSRSRFVALALSTTTLITSVGLAIRPASAAIGGGARADRAEKRVRPNLEKLLDRRGAAWGTPVLLRIFKHEAELEVWAQTPAGRFSKLKTYPICAFSGTLGPKTKQGDAQAPEGFYRVTPGRLNPVSSYHLSMNLGYPNAFDRAHGRTGDYLMVHGNCVSIGCYAMTDGGIEEIYTLVTAALRAGQREVHVHALPFRFANDWKRRNPADDELRERWSSFWENLAEGDALFRATGRPPGVSVRDGRYVFTAADS